MSHKTLRKVGVEVFFFFGGGVGGGATYILYYETPLTITKM